MNASNLWTVYTKELRELLRDRKTLIFSVLLPTLIMPVLFVGIAWFTMVMQQKEQARELDYAVINAEAAPEVTSALAQAPAMQRAESAPAPEAIREVIQAGELDFVLEIPQDFSSRRETLDQLQVMVHLNDSSSTNQVFERVSAMLRPLGDSIQAERLERIGVAAEQAPGLVEPLAIQKRNTADMREDIGEKIGGFLPYILILVALSGAIYPALDLGVGEKERGTLETLLLTPVARTDMVLAKFLVLFTTSFIAVLLTLLSMGVFISLGINLLASKGLPMGAFSEMLSSVGFGALAMMFVMLVPVAAIFSALLLLISIYAKNFKEAQNYISPLTFVAIVPIIIALLPGVSLDWRWALVPLTNVALAIKEIIKGTMDYAMVGAIFFSTAVLAGLMIWITVRSFNKESVLFRT